MDIISATVESLLLGQAPDRDTWLHLATLLSDEPRSPSEDAMLSLAQIVASEDVGSIHTLVETIPAGYQAIRAVGAAVAASRSVDMTSPGSLSKLVLAMYSLLPYLEDRSLVQPAFERLIDLQARALEIGGEPLDLPGFCMFTNLVNTLAMMGLGDPSRLQAALALGDRLHLCPAEPGRYMATSNLVTTCKQLAKHRPSEAPRYLLRGVELASSLFDARREIEQAMIQDVSHAHLYVAQALRNLVIMFAELSAISPERSAEHASAAWKYMAIVRERADEQGDPDQRLAAADLEKLLLERVGPLPGAPPREEEAPLGSMESLHDSCQRMCEASWEAAHRALELPAEDDRKRAIKEHLEGLYRALAKDLAPAVQEVGINRHVSRLLLALGAIASGRLWPLSLRAVYACVLYLPPLGAGALYAHNLEGSQEVPPRRILDERSSYAATISAIAAFSDAFYNDDELSETLRGVLREQNRELLARVLPAIEPQHLPGRSMSKMEDMAHIMTLVQHFGGRREPAPAPAGDGHAEAAPAPAEIAEPPDVEPKWLDPFVFDSEPGGSERPILRPEDMVGLTGRMGGEPYKVDAIISKGTQKVVLGITHMETGHQLALAMFLSSFGPEAQLTDHLERIESNQQAYNPDEVIALCDPVLAISPTSWTAGFSKGIALSIKEDFAGALEAFDSALAGDPEDLYGLLYKAHALAQLSDHSGAVVHIARAARLHPDAFGELFGGMDSIRDTLAASIREVLRQDPERADARELMEKHLA